MQGPAERAYTVTGAGSYAAARDALCEAAYDLIVLDPGLPDRGSLDLLLEWHKTNFKGPVLILSARDSVRDQIKRLDLRADDCLPKPFSLEELLVRVCSQVAPPVGGSIHSRLQLEGGKTITQGTAEWDLDNGSNVGAGLTGRPTSRLPLAPRIDGQYSEFSARSLLLDRLAARLQTQVDAGIVRIWGTEADLELDFALSSGSGCTCSAARGGTTSRTPSGRCRGSRSPPVNRSPAPPERSG